jgi:murein L,D-transpeptidase YafK
MRMTRAWLILADILVTAFLLLSFILFYLYSPVKKQTDRVISSSIIIPAEKNITFESIPKILAEQNVTMTFEEFMSMADRQMIEEITVNKYIDDTLEERLVDLSAKIGDAVFIRIFKKESILEVWIRSKTEYKHLKDYPVCAYSGYLGPKLKEGDRQSPEGFYKIKKHHLNPNSKFHLSFDLGYPNKYDRVHERTGSFLMVHGNCVSIGCYAMTDEKIEEIYELVESALDKGQKYVQVHIYPFRMTEENMVDYSENEWYDFWVNLKDGYDYFEAEKLPPHINVEHKIYIISESEES